MTTDKPIGQLNETDLQQLIAGGVMEGKRIEYKQTFDIEKDEGKRKFLASIASFANASGGDMIFGIQAVNGKPVGILPLQNFEPDSTKLRLINMIRDGIAPKVFGVEFQDVSVEGGHTLIIRIPKTYVGVHMVAFNKDNRFYARGVNGRVLMDVAEIKAAFTLSDAVTEKVRKWRMERIAAVLADETPRSMDFSSRVVIHIMPLSSFDALFKADLSPLIHDLRNLVPLGADCGTITLDFEGVFCYRDMKGEGKADAYTYAFRNGCVETVDASSLRPWAEPNEKRIYGEVIEGRIVDYIDRVVRLLKQIGAEPPFFLALSFLNVREYTMAVGNRYMGRAGHSISKDHLFLPELFLESFHFDTTEVLRESFNMIWNACGWPRSHNYDANNKWNPQQ
jgi:hypothetical protein